MTAPALAELLGDWGYPTYLLLLVATGMGSPVPEDLILATAGYLIAADVFSWPGALVGGVLGVVISDAILYGVGRQLRGGANNGRMRWLVRPHHLSTAERWLVRFGDKAVFLARLLPGTRTVAFIGAGVRGLPFARFLMFDVAGALVWVPLVLFLGAQLGQEIGGLEQLLAAVGRVLAGVVIVGILLAVVWRWWRPEASKL